MLLKIVYLLVRWILGSAVLVLRRDLAKDAELLVLRHENAVLHRHAGRMRYEPGKPSTPAGGPQLTHNYPRGRQESRPSCVRATAEPGGTQLDLKLQLHPARP